MMKLIALAESPAVWINLHVRGALYNDFVVNYKGVHGFVNKYL